MGRERHEHLPVKTQCFAHVGISCELGNRKKWDERHMQHLPVKTPCFLACRSLMFSHLLVSKLCCGNINVHAADLLPN